MPARQLHEPVKVLANGGPCVLQHPGLGIGTRIQGWSGCLSTDADVAHKLNESWLASCPPHKRDLPSPHSKVTRDDVHVMQLGRELKVVDPGGPTVDEGVVAIVLGNVGRICGDLRLWIGILRPSPRMDEGSVPSSPTARGTSRNQSISLSLASSAALFSSSRGLSKLLM